MSDVRGSVYSPGAGHTPKVLAGRDDLLHAMTLRLNDITTEGRVRAEDVIFTGIRGVGKTALLSAYAGAASSQGFEVISHQAVRGQSGLVEVILARAQQRIDQGAGAWKRAKRALDRVTGVSLGVAGVSAGVNVRDPDHRRDRPVYPEALAEALATLGEEIRRDTPTGGVLVTIDEMQVASASDLPLLAATLHRLNVDHPAAPVAFAGTGLPHVPMILRQVGVTHPDRLFLIEELPPTLQPPDALYAIIEPARRAGVMWAPEAAHLVVTLTNGYPAHLQLFADEAWKSATGPHSIGLPDVEAGAVRARDRLVRQNLGPRLAELPGRQLEYLAAVAVCGGRATTRTVAGILGRSASELSWIRDDLLREGDIYSPARGQVAMAIPAFAPFLLSRYEHARQMTETELMPLEDMKRRNPDAAREIEPPAAGPARLPPAGDAPLPQQDEKGGR